MSNRGHWILLDSLIFVNNIFVSVVADEPLDLALRRVYGATLRKLMFYSGCTQGVHLFSHTHDDQGERPHVLELDYLYHDSDGGDPIDAALLGRNPTGSKSSLIDPPPSYVHIHATDFEAHGLQMCLRHLLPTNSSFLLKVQRKHEWQRLFDFCNRNPYSSSGTSLMNCHSNSILVIPLGKTNDEFVTSGLGTILLWRNSAGEMATNLGERAKSLEAPTKSIGFFLGQFFESHYGMSQKTYLPSYRKAEQKNVAIMFADIRDFTPTTEICRNFNLDIEWKQFMVDYCKRMCEIIQKHGGRMHAFAGDGIVALFGEYVCDPKCVLRSVVEAAKEMCGSFVDLKQSFFSQKRIHEFIEREYEPMDFQLGIGINYGPVVFDYFGAPGSRVYCPLGDHVNFAQRLESQAARFDDRLGRQRAPILLSRPAWHAASLNTQPSQVPLTLHVKGKPYDYQAFEISL